jgi:hypothetical protein
MKCTDIFNKAKEDIISFINYEIRLICKAESWPDDEEELYVEFEKNNPRVTIDVDNSYLDVEDILTESRIVTQVFVTDDDHISCEVCSDNDNEDDIVTDILSLDTLSMEELVSIGNALENIYKNLK